MPREKGTHVNECRCISFKPGVNMLPYLDKLKRRVALSVETCRLNGNLINRNTSGIGLVRTAAGARYKDWERARFKMYISILMNNQSDTFESQISVICRTEAASSPQQPRISNPTCRPSPPPLHLISCHSSFKLFFQLKPLKIKIIMIIRK